MQRICSLALLLFFALPPAALAQSALLVVDDDGGPGVDFTELQAAVDAAPAKSVLLVRAGTYAAFSIAAQSVSVIADAGAQPRVLGAPTITDLAVGQSVLLQGLRFAPAAAGSAAGTIANCAGWIGLEDCDLEAPASGASTLRIEDALQVFVARTTITGPAPGPTSAALHVLDSQVHLYDALLFGGSAVGSAPGGDALLLEQTQGASAFAFASGCSFQGGVGAPGQPQPCSAGSEGGAGVRLLGTAPALTRLDSPTLGGAGGADAGCGGGADGPALIGAGALVDLPGCALSFVVDSPVSSGGIAINAFEGPPTALVFLLIATAPSAQHLPVFSGTFTCAAPFFTFFVGVVPPSGTLLVPVPVTLNPSVEAFSFYEQSAFLLPGGAIQLSAPSYPVVVQ